MPALATWLGLDLSALDVARFLSICRWAFVLVAPFWLLTAAWRKRPLLLLAGICAANAWVWFAINFPLQRLYALGSSRDRSINLALCQMAAAHFSPLSTPQVGQLSFEPFWSLLAAAGSGFDSERLLALYPAFSLVAVVGFALALYLGLRPPSAAASEWGAWSTWERVTIAGFATLLSTAPLDFLATYRAPWALTFLLKPNHALGLVLWPLFLGVFARARSWRGRVAAGVLLHLVGWAFILHMVFVCVGLVAYCVLSGFASRAAARDALGRSAVAIGVNLAIVSPYLIVLLVAYPVFDRHPTFALASASPHLLEPLRAGWVFWLSLWGTHVAWKRGDALGRVFAGQVVGAVAVWVGYLALDWLQLAKERDEAYYWLRFTTAAAAGIGAWDLGLRAVLVLGRPAWAAPRLRIACVGLVVLPFTLPAWWEPRRMDPYFEPSLQALPPTLAEPTAYFRRATPDTSVVAGDLDYARYVAALGARRVLVGHFFAPPRDNDRRYAVREALLFPGPEVDVRQAARSYGVTHLVVTPAVLSERPGLTLDRFDARTELERVHHTEDVTGEFVTIYRLRDP